MAIAHVPEELKIHEPLTCSICLVRLELSKATAGMVGADNHQAFACVSHFSEIELLITGWANFITSERDKYKLQQQGGVSNAWLNT